MKLATTCLVLMLTCITTQALANETGRAVFQQNCVSCHGATGQADPDSPVVKALGVFPADFTDPLFNSREPAGDWAMVIKYGGAALGLASQMPAHEAVLNDEEIDAVVRFIKSLSDTKGYPPGELNLFLPIRTKKAFPEDEYVLHTRFTDENGEDSQKYILEFEKRVGKSGQVIAELVYESEPGKSELAEAEIGFKNAIFADDKQVLSAAAVLAIPVESDGDGELQAYLAHGIVLSDAWTLQSSFRLKFPLDGADDGSAELAGILHWTHSPWPRRVFPGFEVVAETPFRSANGDLEWTAMPQVRIGLTRGGHVALNLGYEIPLTGQAWDRRYYATLLWDFADGSFFQGW